MSLFLRVFKHLLPNGKAWRITTDKNLRSLIEGLTGTAQDVRTFTDLTYLDINPTTTRELETWSEQFAIYGADRSRLSAAWKAQGGQDPAYIQATLRAAGFDVYVHDWWQPDTAPALGVHARATPRNPLLVLRPTSTTTALMVECGEPEAQCGEEWAQCGNRRNPPGYPLVNKVSESRRWQIAVAGGRFAIAGKAEALAGNYRGHRDYVRQYTLPSDASLWPYFLYIGGADFGTIAKVPQERRAEFEALALQIAPLHLWLGILVEYV